MEWVILTLMSAFLIGFKQVFSKKILMEDHACEFMTTYCIFAFLFTIPFISKMDFNISVPAILLIYAKSIILCIAWLFQAKALRHMDISKIAPLLNLSPLFLVVLSFFFLGELPSPLQFAGIGLIIFGAYWLQSHHDFRQFLKPWSLLKNKFSVYVIIALFGYSVCSLLDKVILRTVNPYTTLFILFFFLAINYSIIQFYKYNGWRDVRRVIIDAKWLVIIVALFAVFSDILYYKAVAIPTAMIALIIPIKRTSSLVATVVGGNLFHEKNITHRIVGCVLMILGVVLIILCCEWFWR